MRLLSAIRFVALIAWRNALRHRRRSALVLGTAAVGMFGILFSMGFSNGMMDAMIRGAVESGLGHVQIRPPGYLQERRINRTLKDPDSLATSIREMQAADTSQRPSFSLRFEREGLLRIGSYQEGVVLLGIDPEQERAISSFDEWLQEGSYLESSIVKEENEGLAGENNPSSTGSDSIGIIPCLIGAINAERMELALDDYVVLTLGDRNSRSVSIRARVAGIYKSPIPGVDRHTVLVRRSDLSRLYLAGDSSADSNSNVASNITLLGRSLDEAPKLDALLENQLGQVSWEVLSFFELQPQIKTMLGYIDDIKGIIYGVLMSGFALTLMNAVLMSVFERTREIGIQMAIGTRKAFIVMAILLESAILAMAGATLGLALGGGFVALLAITGIDLGGFGSGIAMMGSMSSVVYPRLTVQDITLGFYVALFMSLLASIYPAWKATGIEPVRAITGRS